MNERCWSLVYPRGPAQRKLVKAVLPSDRCVTMMLDEKTEHARRALAQKSRAGSVASGLSSKAVRAANTSREGPPIPISFLRSHDESHGWRLSFKRPKRENARREMERAWQGELSHMDLGGEQTPIVHATEHSLKATSVMIASAGL